MFEKNAENVFFFFLEVTRWISPIIFIFILLKQQLFFLAFICHNFTEQHNYLHFLKHK